MSKFVQRLHAKADEWIAMADAMDVTGPFIRNGRTYPPESMWHPASRAALLREEAAVLLSWTEDDEIEYLTYITDEARSDTLEDAPMSRALWKATE